MLFKKYWEIRNPVQILKKCMEDKEWFKGIVLSTAFLEGVGQWILSIHFKEQIASERFKNLRLELIIMFLHASSIIDQPTYSEMIEVKKFRDDIVHLAPFKELKLQPKQVKAIIQKAINCLEILIQKWLEEYRVTKQS